eukprot:6325902-Pyramimonas_sp.AAC.1
MASANKRRRRFHERPDDAGQQEAGKHLLTMLQTAYCRGELTAKAFGEIAFESWKAGAQHDALRERGLPCGSPSGHFQRKIDEQIHNLNMSKIDFILLEYPCQAAKSRRRALMNVDAKPMRELLREEVFRTSMSRASMKNALGNRSWPTVYTQHP